MDCAWDSRESRLSPITFRTVRVLSGIEKERYLRNHIGVGCRKAPASGESDQSAFSHVANAFKKEEGKSEDERLPGSGKRIPSLEKSHSGAALGGPTHEDEGLEPAPPSLEREGPSQGAVTCRSGESPENREVE